MSPNTPSFLQIHDGNIDSSSFTRLAGNILASSAIITKGRGLGIPDIDIETYHTYAASVLGCMGYILSNENISNTYNSVSELQNNSNNITYRLPTTLDENHPMVLQIENCFAHLRERFSEEMNKTDDQPLNQLLLETESNADEYRAVFPSKEELLREGPRGIQYKLAKIMARLSNKSYIQHHRNSIDDIARKHSASLEGSVLITTIPAYSTITFPSDGEAMRLLLATRLGLPIPNLDEGPCNCKWKGRQGYIDKLGLHTFVHCRLDQSKHNVHDKIKAEIMTFLTKAGHRPKPERSTSLQEVDPNTKKRTDITYQYNASTYCDIDITVTDFRAQKASSKTLQVTPGNPSNLAERRKITQYKDKLPKDNGHIFHAYVMENRGRWGKTMRREFNKHLKVVQRNTECFQDSKVKESWIARITMAMFIAEGQYYAKKLHLLSTRQSAIVAFHNSTCNLSEDDQLARDDVEKFNDA